MEVKATFDESGFSTRITTVTSQLESDYESYVKATMKSAATSGLDTTLSDFKKSVVTTPRTTFPEEVYTALMQQYVVNAPEVKEINGELVKAVDDYVVDILEDNTQTVSVGDTTYTISYNFGKLLGLATVTAPDGKSYTVSWKNNNAQDSYIELLGNIKEYGNNFAVTFWTALTSDMASNFIDDVFNVIVYHSEKSVTPVINYLKLAKAIDADSTDKLSSSIESLTNFLGETLFPKIFPNSNKTITNAQKQYQTLLQRKSALLNDLGDDKDVASLSSYKKFVTAFNDLETTIGQSQTSFDAIINEYTAYEFSDVANSEIDENRALINGNDDANVIIANGYSVTLNGNGGDDTLVANGANALLSGGLGNDSIMNTGYQDTLNGDEGDDLIIVEGNSSSVNGGAGKDKIIVNGSDVTVDGGSNSDSLPVPDIIRIETEAKNVVVKNFENADSLDLSIYNADELSAGKYQTNSVTIYSRKTNETIVILEDVTNRASNNILCKAESGEVTAVSTNWLLENTPPIVNPYETVKPDDGEQTGETIKPDSEKDSKIINGENGGDTITNSSDGMTINLATGNNSVNNSGNSVTINGGADKDTVTNSGNSVSIVGGDGNDFIYNYEGSYVIINGEADNDFISNNGSDVTMDGGIGNDEINNYGECSNIIINGGEGNDSISNRGLNVSISGGTSNDSVYNFGDSVTIAGGEGDDSIFNWQGENISISGGNDNDTIENNGTNVTINGGDGNDTITNNANGDNVINSGEGNDKITNYGEHVSISGNEGNDVIYNTGYGNNVTIDGGSGDDSIYTAGSNVSIIGGEGDDSIVAYGKKELFKYDSGDGNDTIFGFDRTDTLSISGGSYTTQTSGNDVIAKVGDGSILLKDAKGLTLNIKGTLDTSRGGSSSTSTTTGGGSSSTTRGGSSYTSTTTGGDSSSSSVTGNSFTSTTTGSSLTSTTPSSSSTSTTTSTTTHNTTNTLTTTSTSTNSTSNVYTGGNAVISNYTSGQPITLGSFTGASFDGNGNFVVQSDSGALVIEQAVDKVIDLCDGNGNAFIKAYTTSTAGVVDGRGLPGYQIINGSAAGSNIIMAGDGGSQLWGGAGTSPDFLCGGAGVDIFTGGRFQGADIFANTSSADVVNLNDASLSDIVATAEINGAIMIGFNTGNIVSIQSTEPLSAAVALADGTAWRFNHVTKSWQPA